MSPINLMDCWCYWHTKKEKKARWKMGGKKRTGEIGLISSQTGIIGILGGVKIQW